MERTYRFNNICFDLLKTDFKITINLQKIGYMICVLNLRKNNLNIV